MQLDERERDTEYGALWLVENTHSSGTGYHKRFPSLIAQFRESQHHGYCLLQLMYFFPGAAVTNFYKPSAFKQHRCTVSQFWSLRIQNQGVSKAILSLKPIGEDPFSPLPQFLMTIGKSWHCLAYSYITFITASKIWLSSLCVSFYKDTSYSDLGTTLMTSSYLITSAKILFPNKVTFTATRN